MRSARRRGLLLAALSVAACGPETPGDPFGASAQSQSNALFNNGGFESGGGSLTNWTVSTFLNNNGLAVFPPTTVADLNLAAGGTNFTFSQTNAMPESQLFSGMA